MQLIPINYGGKPYPVGIAPKIQEVAAHFDVKNITPNVPYSLHTEYSYGKRSFDSKYVKHLSEIYNSHKQGVPCLWKNKKWAEEFFEFVVNIASNLPYPPAVIEIHPPFNDYCESIEDFIEVYSVFEKLTIDYFPQTEILIENRCGSIYTGGKFLIRNVTNIADLCSILREKDLRLKAVVDFPQLFTAHGYKINNGNNFNSEMHSVFSQLETCRNEIRGLHLWGKKVSETGRTVSHCGDLDSYFNYNKDLKDNFLQNLRDLFSDDKSRLFVPEVNSSSSDMQNIVRDLLNYGFKFI